MNAIIPIIVRELETKPSKVEFPKIVDDIVGDYSVANTTLFTIQKTKETDSTGIFSGLIMGSMPVTFTYDEKTTKAYNKDGTHFFHMRMVTAAPYDSCNAIVMMGVDDDAVMFQYTESSGQWSVSLSDFSLILTKDPKPASSSGSSSSPHKSSAEISSTSSSSALCPLLIALPLAWLLCFFF